MEYRNRIIGQRWLAKLLLITVTSSIAPLYVVADETSETKEVSPTAESAGVAEVLPEEPEAAVAGESEVAEPDEVNEATDTDKPAEVSVGTEEELPQVADENPSNADSSVATEDLEEVPPVTDEDLEGAVVTNTKEAGEAQKPDTSSDVVPASVGEGNAEHEQTALSENIANNSSTATGTETEDTVVATSSAGNSTAPNEEEATNSNNNERNENTSNDTDDDESVRKNETETIARETTASSSTDSSSETSPNENQSVAGVRTSPATDIVSTSTSTEESSNVLEEDATTTAAVTIESGKAVALANVINIVNTNFVNSEGVVFFSNFLDVVKESIDFRWLYEALTSFGCSLSSCNSTDITVNSSDTASIDNQMYLEAISGGNTISGATSGAINTGDAYAGLNLINVANMNFIDSNYLLVTLNAFSDVDGDIVFPSADAFLSTLAGRPGDVSIETANNAHVQNNVTVDANTGDNTLETAAGGSISTGASGATSNVFNQINSSFLGGQNVTILFRVHGDWAGEVFGAPQDLVWQQGPDGSVFVFDTDSNSNAIGGSRTVLTENSASIHNDVQVVALTGENKITGAETGIISAGNAYAGANIVNLANGTVVGRNWILAIINIFGDFKGNIAFGRPDLWVGQMIDAPQNVREGAKLTYKFSVINNGDSTASDVTLIDAYDSNYLKVIDSSVPYLHSEAGVLQFDIGTLRSGEATEITYTATVSGVGNKSRKITNTVNVKSKETDNNLSDNTDTATIVTSEKRSNSSVTRVGERRNSQNVIQAQEHSMVAMAADLSDLQVLRTSSATTLNPQSPVIQQFIALSNRGETIIPSLQYVDILTDPNGEIIEQQTWDLGDVLPGEEIELGYTITFGGAAPRGTYAFTSAAKSGVYEQVYQNGTLAFLGSKSPILEMMHEAAGVVLGASRFTEAFSERIPERKVGSESSRSGIVQFVPFPEEDIFALPVATHSVSTTQQQSNNQKTLSMWLNQLYVFISSLVSKLALTMNT